MVDEKKKAITESGITAEVCKLFEEYGIPYEHAPGEIAFSTSIDKDYLKYCSATKSMKAAFSLTIDCPIKNSATYEGLLDEFFSSGNVDIIVSTSYKGREDQFFADYSCMTKAA